MGSSHFCLLPTVVSINTPPYNVLMGEGGRDLLGHEPYLYSENAWHCLLFIICELAGSLQLHVPRSGRPWEDQGISVSAPSACHLLAILWPPLLMGLVSL